MSSHDLWGKISWAKGEIMRHTRTPIAVRVSLAFLSVHVLTVGIGGSARAVSCPDPGSRVKVCVTNADPTTTFLNVKVSGQVTGTGSTCQGPHPITGFYEHTFDLPPGSTCFQGASALPQTPKGLVSGIYVHKIEVPSTGQVQYQKGPVLFSSTGQWAQVSWTAFLHVFKVDQLGDATSCSFICNAGGPCTLRGAINRANNLTTDLGKLIQFTVAGEFEMSQPCSLSINKRNITIDGTDSNGDPWIVGDKYAAAAGNQDTFPRVVDLNNAGSIEITDTGVLLKGLHIKNTLPINTAQSKNIIWLRTSGSATIRDSKVEGGNTLTCPGGSGCTLARDLINSESLDVEVVNVEGHSGLDKGVKIVGPAVSGEIRESWFHHNYRGGLQVTESPALPPPPPRLLSRGSIIEFSGRRITDNAVMDDGADGISAKDGDSEIFRSEFNVVARNRNNGWVVRDGQAKGCALADFSCGNRLSGFAASNTTASTAVNIGYSAAAHNALTGFAATGSQVSGPLQPSNGFVNNDNVGACDVSNSTASAVAATNNQWGTSTPKTCGAVTWSPVQNAVTVDLDLGLDPTHPIVAPTNALLRGQTLRVTGIGFNAITGSGFNPATQTPFVSCTRGDTSDDSSSCCVLGPPAGNVCGTGVHNPVLGKGQCVELSDRSGTWTPLTVRAVAPGMIVTEVPTELFACRGTGDSTLWVSKRLTATTTDADSVDYCNNSEPAYD